MIEKLNAQLDQLAVLEELVGKSTEVEVLRARLYEMIGLSLHEQQFRLVG